jgi:ADP-ribose pyrophosphatase YjhB (NUDIX family)
MMTPSERHALFQAGIDNGWHELIIGENEPTETGKLFVVFDVEANDYVIVTVSKVVIGLKNVVSSDLAMHIKPSHRYWKPFDGNVRPFPGEIVFHNPPTVVVVLVPVASGLLLVRRAAYDTHGKLALPGGFQEVKDGSWQVAGCREVFEETGIVLDPALLKSVATETVEGGKVNLLFAVYQGRVDDPQTRDADQEILEVLTTDEPVETAFETHTRWVKEFFTSDLAKLAA